MNIPEYEISRDDVLKKRGKNVVFLDVREDVELNDTGIIAGSIHIPLGKLSPQALAEKGITKDDEIITICRSGNRSKKAYDMLTSWGYARVKSMQGGIKNWQREGKPLEKWSSETSSSSPNETSAMQQKKLPSERVIAITASRWKFSTPEIRVQQGEKVRLRITNSDTLHGITIPDLQQTGTEEILLDTSKKGKFPFQCATFCGEGHNDMKGMLIVE